MKKTFVLLFFSILFGICSAEIFIENATNQDVTVIFQVYTSKIYNLEPTHILIVKYPYRCHHINVKLIIQAHENKKIMFIENPQDNDFYTVKYDEDSEEEQKKIVIQKHEQ